MVLTSTDLKQVSLDIILGEEIPWTAISYWVSSHQSKLRLNSARIFIGTAKSQHSFSPLEESLCLLGAIMIVLHSFLAQYIDPSIVYTFRLLLQIPFSQTQYRCSANDHILSFLWHQVCLLLWAMGSNSWIGYCSDSTQNWDVATGLTTQTSRTIGNGPVFPPNTRHLKFTIWAPINGLSSDPIMAWSIWTLYSFGRSFSSPCQVCNRTNIPSVGIHHLRILLELLCYFTAIQWILVHCQSEHVKLESGENCTSYVLIMS